MRLAEIASVIGSAVPPQWAGSDIARIASPEAADAHAITFLAQKQYRDAVERSAARFVIVGAGVSVAGKVCLETADPYVAFARTARLFEDRSPAWGAGVSDRAFVDPQARIHPTASIGPLTAVGRHCSIGEATVVDAGCVIESGVSIGRSCRIDSGVVIRRGCRIGDRVIVQSGAVIGSDGFGNAWEKDHFVRIPSFGVVVIEDDVEVGANTTIDRGTFGDTVVKKGAKLDNLVHLAHNVTVGEHSALAAQCGVSGSTAIGSRVKVGGQAGFVGHITVGDDAFVGAKAGVSKDVTSGEKVTGYPARGLMKMRRIEATTARLPELLRRVREIERKTGMAGAADCDAAAPAT